MRPMALTTTRDILAQNIRRQIEHDLLEGEKFSVRGWALGKGLDVKLVKRMLKNHNAVTLGKLQQVADACGCQPWHLLLDTFEPGQAPDAPLSADDRAMLERLRRMFSSSNT